MRNMAQQIFSIFYHMRGEDPRSRHRPKERHTGTVISVYDYQKRCYNWTGKPSDGRRPARTYRAARRNALLENRAHSLKLERIARGITRREHDRMRRDARN